MGVHLFAGLGSMGGPRAGSRLCGYGPPLQGSLPLPPTTLTISGVTKDETGAAGGGYTVYLFEMTTGVPVLVQTTISDANGNYAFSVGPGERYWAVDYKTGTPDKSGASVNTLVGV
jgi:hypothetical protein